MNLSGDDYIYNNENKIFAEKAYAFIEALKKNKSEPVREELIKAYKEGRIYDEKDNTLFHLNLDIPYEDVVFLLKDPSLRRAFFKCNENEQDGFSYLFHGDFFSEPQRRKYDHFFACFSHEDNEFKSKLMISFYENMQTKIVENYTWLFPLIAKHNMNAPELDFHILNILGFGIYEIYYTPLYNNEGFYNDLKKCYPDKSMTIFLYGSSNVTIIEDIINNLNNVHEISKVVDNLEEYKHIVRADWSKEKLVKRKVEVEKEQLSKTMNTSNQGKTPLLRI